MASCSTNSYDGRLATLTVTVASQSIENNQTTLSWELKVSGGKVNNYNAYAITAWVGGTDDAHKVYGPVDKAWDSYAFPAVKGTKTGTVVIDHNADGTHGQVQIRIRGSFYNNNPTNHDAYLDIPTIPRASNVSCDNVTLGNSVTINCPRASTGFTNTLYIKDGNTTIETFSGVGDSKSWTPTLANYGNRIVLSKQFTIQCDTYSGGTYIGTKYCYPTLSFPSGYGPTCSLSVSPNNSNCPSAWGNRYVQYKSMVNVSVGFSGQYGATLSSRTSAVPNAGTNSSASWVSNTLSTNGTLTVTASVTDNRNRTANASQQITVYPYFSPRITRNLAERNNNTLTVTYSFEIASVDGANTHQFQVYYKKTSQTWNEATRMVNDTSHLTITNGTATATLEATSSYDIKFIVSDSTGDVTTYASVGTQFDLMNFHSSGLAMAIGKMSEAGANEKLFEVGIPSRFTDHINAASGLSSSYIYSNGYMLKRTVIISTSNLNTNTFYPVLLKPDTSLGAPYALDCEIHSQGRGGSDPYNQNYVHFRAHAGGWSDTPTNIIMDECRQYDSTEITIGAIGWGTARSYMICVWVRGGNNYAFVSNAVTGPTLYTSDVWDPDSASNGSKFTVGTNFYGGSNVGVDIGWIAGNQINWTGMWVRSNITMDGYFKTMNGLIYNDNMGVLTTIGAQNSGLTHYMTTAGSGHYFNKQVLVAGNVYAGSNYNRLLAYNDEVGATVGTSGIWRYIKFNNGYAICVGRQRISTKISSSWGNIYSSGDLSLNDFPFTFAEVPYVNYSPHAGADNGAGGYSSFVASGNASATTTNPGKILLLRGKSEGTARNYDVIIQAFGRWK